jgi:hypothetical protein
VTAPTPAPNGGLAVQILALGAQQQQLRDQLDDLSGIGDRVTGFADDLAKLGAKVDKLEARDQDKENPVRLWDWSKMNRAEANVAWKTLIEWVNEVLAGVFGAVGEIGGRKHKLAPCWYQHPDAVAELSWLCQEWLRLYRSTKGTPAGAGEWHDRWLPGVIKRLEFDSPMADCLTEGRHVEPRPGQAIDDPEVLGELVQADIDRRPEAPPAPIKR